MRPNQETNSLNFQVLAYLIALKISLSLLGKNRTFELSSKDRNMCC